MFGVMQLRHYVLLIFVFSPASVGKAIMSVTHTARIGNWLYWLSISWAR